MDYKEILENYRVKKTAHEEKEKFLDEKIERTKKRLKKLEAQLEKHDSKYIGWVDGIVVPLAEELAKKFNMTYEIFGPFGLCCETSIYLKEDKNKCITEQATLSITLEPGVLSKCELLYRTGERTNSYLSGSIGDLNGFDYIKKPPPDTIEQIAKLMTRNEAIK